MLVFLERLIDPAAMMIVFAGAFALAMLQVGWNDGMRMLAALSPMLRARPRDDRDAARLALVRVENLAHLRGVQCTDRVRSGDRFLSSAIQTLANAAHPKDFVAWSQREISDRSDRHAGAVRGWLAVADAAPALGMAGTIIGMVRMFANMDDPAALGPAMALALLTTLYGVVLANGIAAPIAARLSMLSEQEQAWQTEISERLASLARAEAAPRSLGIRGVA